MALAPKGEVPQPRRAVASSGARRPRVGVVLAAGRSERLSSVTGGGSKALVRVGGLALVERAIKTLFGAGIEEIIVVVGYHAGPVAAVVKRGGDGGARTVMAEGWERGNGASLAAVEELVAGEPLFALVTADHMFAQGALEGLLASEEPAVLIDPAPEPDAWDEGCRVRLLDGRAVAFSKELSEPGIDCGAFVLPPAIFDAQREAAEDGDHSLAAAVSRFAARRPMRVVDLPTGSWWQDVDTPADLGLAKARLRRSLTKEGDGPVSRYLNRPLSTRLSMLIAPLRISPDLLSLVAFLVGIAAAWLVAAGNGLAGGIAAHVSSVLDGVDGEVARLQLRQSPRGALLDGVLDRIGDAAILGALGIWALRDHSPSLVLALTVAATAGAILSMASKDRITALGLPPAPERVLGWLLGGRDGRLAIIAVGAILGQPFITLAAVTATSALSLVLRVLMVRGSAPASA